MKRGPAPTRAARLILGYGEGGRMASASWTDHDSAPAVPTPQALGRRWGRVLGQIGWASVPIWSLGFLSFVPFLAFAVIQRDLANALTAHCCEARTTAQGMAVTSAPNA